MIQLFLPEMIGEHDKRKNYMIIIMPPEHLGDESINDAIQSMPLIVNSDWSIYII